MSSEARLSRRPHRQKKHLGSFLPGSLQYHAAGTDAVRGATEAGDFIVAHGERNQTSPLINSTVTTSTDMTLPMGLLRTRVCLQTANASYETLQNSVRLSATCWRYFVRVRLPSSELSCDTAYALLRLLIRQACLRAVLECKGSQPHH